MDLSSASADILRLLLWVLLGVLGISAAINGYFVSELAKEVRQLRTDRTADVQRIAATEAIVRTLGGNPLHPHSDRSLRELL